MTKKLYLVLGLTLCTVAGFAQIWEVGINAGAAGYIGDLNPNHLMKPSGLQGGAYVKHNLNSQLGVRFQYHFAQIKANDADSKDAVRQDRNLNFNSNLHEAGLLLDFTFYDFKLNNRAQRISPYIFSGIAGFYFNPKASYQNKIYELVNYHTEAQEKPYKRLALSIPYGVGIKMQLDESWSIFSDLAYRTAFTDYIDDVSGYYPALAKQAISRDDAAINLSDPSITGNKAYQQRGDLRKRDTYFFASIGITFTFVSSKCYNF